MGQPPHLITHWHCFLHPVWPRRRLNRRLRLLVPVPV